MSYTGNPQDLPGLFAALEERVRALENRTVSVAGGTLPHNHMGSGTDSTVVAGLLDSVPPIASGVDSVAAGVNSHATGQSAVSIGEGSEATGKAGVAIGGKADTGTGAAADGDYSVAIGSDAVVVNDYSTVVGAQVRSGDSGTDGTGSVLIGTYVIGQTASHRFAIGIGGHLGAGVGTLVEADRAIAVGYEARGSHADAAALGTSAQTTNSHQIQLGTAADRTIMGAPNSAIADADLTNGQISFYLDETGNTLTVKAKYSTGAVKTGTIALV